MRLQDVDSFSLTSNIARLNRPVQGGDVIHRITQVDYMIPRSRRRCCHFHAERMVSSISRGCPSGVLRWHMSGWPIPVDVAGAAWCDTVGNLYACGALKGGYGVPITLRSVACAEVEDFNLGFRLVFQHTLYGDYVGFGKIDHIDEVADAVAVACIVVVAGIR